MINKSVVLYENGLSPIVAHLSKSSKGYWSKRDQMINKSVALYEKDYLLLSLTCQKAQKA